MRDVFHASDVLYEKIAFFLTNFVLQDQPEQLQTLWLVWKILEVSESLTMK